MRNVLFSALIVLTFGFAQAELVDNGDGTVTDTGTGLMWQQDTSGPMSWAEAMAYCRRLVLAGYDDWRLPNLYELRSIVNGDYRDPAINTAFFPDTRSDRYWSSDTSELHSNEARHIDFARGHDYEGFKSQRYFVRAVRSLE
jgi:hypothetical protein